MARQLTGRSRARALAYYESKGRTAEAERIRAEMKAAEECEDCGAHLEDPDSIKRRVGPTCWAKRQRRAATV